LFDFLEKRKKLLVFTPLIIYWIVLFIATTIPVESVPKIAVSDKMNHLAAYFLLSVLLYMTLIYQRKSFFLFNNAAITALLIAAFYGAFDEIHQLFVPGRFAEFLDWLADVAGSLLGVLFISFLMKKMKYIPNFN
jgi:VanZ family protein